MSEIISIPNLIAYVWAAGKAADTNWSPWFVIIFPNLANPLGFWLLGREAFTVCESALISIIPLGFGICMKTT